MLKNMSWAQIGFILRKFEQEKNHQVSYLDYKSETAYDQWNSPGQEKEGDVNRTFQRHPFKVQNLSWTWSGNFWPLNRCLSIVKKYRTKSFGRMSPTNSETMRFGISRTVLSFVFFNCIYNISLFDHWNHIQHDQNMLSSVSLIPFNDDSELMNHKDRRLYVIIETVP